MTLEDWQRVMSVNLASMLLMAKAFVPGMQARRWGRIVNIASATVNLVEPFSGRRRRRFRDQTGNYVRCGLTRTR